MIINNRAVSWLIFVFLFIFFFIPLKGFDDSQWVQKQEESLIFYYQQRDSQLMETLLPMIISDIDVFQRAIGFYPQIKGEIVIAPDRDYYQEIVSGYSGVIEFSEAVYRSIDKRIYVRNPRDLRDFTRLRRIILHEYVHLFLDTHFYNVPLWFHEGMAVFFSRDLSFERELLYARDYLLGNSLTLNEMSREYPANRVRWESFYAKSGLAVKYLYTRHREEFYSLWEYTDSPSNFYLSFFKAFNLTPRQFSTLLEEHLKRRFRIEMLLAFSGIVWGVLPFILLLAWLRKKWLNRKIKLAWETPPPQEESDPALPSDRKDSSD